MAGILTKLSRKWLEGDVGILSNNENLDQELLERKMDSQWRWGESRKGDSKCDIRAERLERVEMAIVVFCCACK